MNAQLLNPFTLDIPDAVNFTLDTADCTTLSFNHSPTSPFAGHYLAVGRSDGLITIWDIETKSVLRLLSGHVRGVTGLGWSSGNRYLASASADWNVIIWDLGAGVGGERKRSVRFDCAVVGVQVSPGDWRRLVVTLGSNEAWLVDAGERVRVRRRRGGGEEVRLEVDEVKSDPKRIQLVGPEGEGITAARFTPDSRFIVAGTSKGTLLIFDATTGSLVDQSKALSTSSGVKELAFDSSGRYLIVNCNDRALRLLSLTHPFSPTPTSSLQLTLQHKMADHINRTPWQSLGFSPSSDYIFAGAAHKASHNVYIYDRPSGTLSRILEGPKDWLTCVDWHPTRPMLASVSNTGAVYVWFTPTDEIWSAYAPGFEELEENLEYEEREDEFDFVEDVGGVGERRRREEEEAAQVRVVEGGRGEKEGLGEEVDLGEVWALLGIDGEGRKGRHCRAFERLAARLGSVSEDSGWVKQDETATAKFEDTANGEHKSTMEMRELVFTVLDDDVNDGGFVIPPRLEVDYSDFYDDHT